MDKNTKKTYTHIYIKKSINQSIYIFYKKWPLWDLSLQFQGKVHNTCDALVATFLATIRVTSNISHICNTKKWPHGLKNGHLNKSGHFSDPASHVF